MSKSNYISGFSDTQDNQKDFGDKYSVGDSGPFIGKIKDTQDPMRMGRLGVVIPALANIDGHNPHVNQITWCQYLSPFYGAKPLVSVSSTDPYSFQQGQTAYGMWAVPPDIDTNVLVIFAKGEKGKSNAFWLGCIQEPLTNHMVPGLASSTNSKMDLNQSAAPGGTTVQGAHDKRQANYGTEFLPVIEKNKKNYEDGEGLGALEQWKLPVNEDLTYQLMRQGLIKDPIRGTTTSSARRETPSQVFGISTPGRFKSNTRTPNIGLAGSPVSVDRMPGHSFVMDDGDEIGENQLIRLRTASGHQLLMHDTEGVVYIANASGNAWIEMNSEGRIDIYSGAGGMNIRTEGDFNLHSDTNVNISAGAGIRMAATGLDPLLYTKDDIAVKNGQKSAGDVAREAIPGSIIQSADYVFNVGEKAIFNTSKDGPIQSYAGSSITSYSGGMQLHGAAAGTQIAGGQIHLNSTKADRAWGGIKQDGGLYDKEGLNIAPTYEGDVELMKKYDTQPLQAFSRKTKTKTIVHRLVTHEPMLRFSAFATAGMLPPISLDGLYAEAEIIGSQMPQGPHGSSGSGGGGGGGGGGSIDGAVAAVSEYVAPLGPRGDVDHGATKVDISAIQETKNWITKKAEDAKKLIHTENLKKWNYLSSIPGTREFLEQRNRLSKFEPLRKLQAEADMKKTFLSFPLSIQNNAKKAQELLKNYGVHYDNSFGIDTNIGSISFAMKDFPLDISNPNEMASNFATSISNQVIDNFTSSATKMLSENVYFDQANKLYQMGTGAIQMGQRLISDVKNFKENAPEMVKSYAISKANSMITNAVSTQLNSIMSPSGLLGGGIFGGALGGNIGAITNISKNIIGGNITNVSQIANAWSARGAGKFLSSGAAGGARLGPNLFSNIGSFNFKAIGSIFSGGGLTKFGGFCFDPDTLVQMADGSEKKIKDIKLGDNTKGGEVTGVFQFKASDEIHDYKGVIVAGSHYVKENNEFIMVKDSPLAIKIDKIPVVYSLDTTGRRIFINDIEFADYNGDSVAKNFLNNAGVDLTGFNKEVLRQVEQRLI